ncbi:MAG: glycosyltransferase family 9 protein [Abditibacteriota bacterium]|nr:glycosyltransferase family 9 protein [Abditibacteriota bacterium]
MDRLRILMVRVSAIGDVFMALPVAMDLKEAADCEITWLCEKHCAGILEGHPAVDRVLVWERNRKHKTLSDLLRANGKIKKQLQGERFDYILDHQGRLKLCGVLAGVKHKKTVGFSDPESFLVRFFYDITVPVGKREIYTDRNRLMVNAVLQNEKLPLCEKTTYPRIRITEEARALAAELLKDAPGRKIGIIFATSKECKYWQKEKWKELIRFVSHELDSVPVLFGGPGDRDYGEEIAAGDLRAVNTAGRTSLTEAAALLEKCSACVCVDTALMHFSVCLDIPTVCLFGSDVYKEQHSLRDNFIIVHKPSDPNRPCHKRCRCPGHQCMKNIGAETVKEALAGALGLKSPGNCEEVSG